MEKEAVIEAKALRKVFNLGKINEAIPVVNVDLEIAKGECVILKGPSGSGKSTLLTLLSCLAKPTSGEYFFNGEKVSRWSEKFLTRFRKKHIGVVFQQFNLINGFTTAKNIAVPLLPLGLPFSQIDKKVEKAAEEVNLSHRLHFDVGKLSGGEQQRVAIARALVTSPEVFFADEPTAHLDSAMSVEILTIFQKLKAEGKTLVITTHDPLVEQHEMVDRVLVMKDGVVKEEN
ncbi:ABC transporter ATP-binding protein [Flammeovirgaceae bacterium SG7u.111]|nr:ABC transporter ATP-binding protein [Flammeovirgaceae bacterium SG7u.132]WPO34087.1 ABC transporter ATP-binding protein [Flammeovirgaceae bacterium SG7u.111]